MNTQSKRKKARGKALVVLSGLLAVVLIIMLWMQLSTNNILGRIEQAVASQKVYISKEMFEREPNRYNRADIDYIIYDNNGQDVTDIDVRFNMFSKVALREDYSSKWQVEYELKRVFAWHNFNRGKLWVKYTYTAYDETGKISYGSKDAIIAIDIEKINGEWKMGSSYERA